ncbi:MAG: hypothetical protein M9920_11985 [Verrucomicrobiae bacterium]|nr:hypothetical protein [Verrucomicrobiae bacterium]
MRSGNRSGAGAKLTDGGINLSGNGSIQAAAGQVSVLTCEVIIPAFVYPWRLWLVPGTAHERGNDATFIAQGSVIVENGFGILKITWSEVNEAYPDGGSVVSAQHRYELSRRWFVVVAQVPAATMTSMP